MRCRRPSTIRHVKRALAVFGIALAGSVVAGAVAGLIWGAVAPRVQLQILAAGAAYEVNPESSGYIAADAWYCVITAVGGLITGLAGYWLLVRRNGWPAALGIVAGAVAAGYTAMWIGGLNGLGAYRHQLATGRVGTSFSDSLSLGAKSAVVVWLLVAAAIVAIGQYGTRGAEADTGPLDPSVSGMWTPPAGGPPRSVD